MTTVSEPIDGTVPLYHYSVPDSIAHKPQPVANLFCEASSLLMDSPGPHVCSTKPSFPFANLLLPLSSLAVGVYE